MVTKQEGTHDDQQYTQNQQRKKMKNTKKKKKEKKIQIGHTEMKNDQSWLKRPKRTSRSSKLDTK